MSRNKEADKFYTVKFVVTLEVSPNHLQARNDTKFTNLKEIQEAVRQELLWLETSGIHLTQLRVKT